MGRVIKWNERAGVSESSSQRTAGIQATVTELAREMASRIVAAEIETSPALLERLYGRALLAARGLEGAAVSVHPEDRSLFDVDRAAVAVGFSVAEDPSVGRGGCRIVGPRGEIDASIAALTEAFCDALKGKE